MVPGGVGMRGGASVVSSHMGASYIGMVGIATDLFERVAVCVPAKDVDDDDFLPVSSGCMDARFVEPEIRLLLEGRPCKLADCSSPS